MVAFPREHPFLTSPLRELTCEDFKCFQYYFRKALTSIGTFEDYCYLLPRMLELIVLETAEEASDAKASMPFDVEVVFGKLTYRQDRHESGDLSHWRSVERDAIDAYLEALWDWVLCRSYGTDDLPDWPYVDEAIPIDDWLVGMLLAGQDLETCLRHWRHCRAWPAAVRLAALIVGHEYEMDRARELLVPFIPGGDPRQTVFWNWLYSRASERQLRHAVEQHALAKGIEAVKAGIECVRSHCVTED